MIKSKKTKKTNSNLQNQTIHKLTQKKEETLFDCIQNVQREVKKASLKLITTNEQISFMSYFNQADEVVSQVTNQVNAMKYNHIRKQLIQLNLIKKTPKDFKLQENKKSPDISEESKDSISEYSKDSIYEMFVVQKQQEKIRLNQVIRPIGSLQNLSKLDEQDITILQQNVWENKGLESALLSRSISIDGVKVIANHSNILK